MTSNWIEWKWTEEKPYPETLDTKVIVKFADGWDDSESTVHRTVAWWRGDSEDQLTSSWHNVDGLPYDIVAYKVAK